jgi:ABC-type transport system involved in multi-copper enzyme maturation permease subunit
MRKIYAIAINTLREATRDKVFYSLLAFAIMMVGFSMVLGNLTIGEPEKIIMDFGMGAISLFGTLIAIFVGIGMVYKEMEKKTIYVILAKPIARWQFLVGKFLGLSVTLLIEVVIMTIILFGVLVFVYNAPVPWILLKAIIPIALKLILLLAVAIFFSTFTTPFLSGLFTLSIFIIGNISPDLKMIADKTENVVLQKICNFTYYGLPNLENLNFKSQVVHSLPINNNEIFLALLYGSCYTVLILTLAILIFEKQDLK